MDNNYNASTDILQDVEQEFRYEDASTGIRFGNYIIDLVAFIVFLLIVFFAIGKATQSDAALIWLEELPWLADRLLSLFLFGLFMGLIEGFTGGRSLGKLITGTKAVRCDNQPFSWGDAFGRGFSRAVPFEPFSALWGSPWHDIWTGTRVVKAGQ